MAEGAYYNENEPYVAAWLRNLIAAGHVPAGDVDERSICEVRSDDLRGYAQCHFFAGIGGWAYAARLAGWPDDRPIWTGSCPCQPFSAANTAGAKGRADERHLWPAFSRLIFECRPPIVFGEQVADAIQFGWLDEVSDDLEAQEYTCAAVVCRASDVGANHDRRRLYWCAYAMRPGQQGYQHNDCLPCMPCAPQPVFGDSFAQFRRVLAGDHSGLLLGHGLPVSVERCAAKGYGNAIVPQVAAEVIGAFMEHQP